jgi:hypothetical protein
MLGIQTAMPYLLEGKSLDPQAALAARIGRCRGSRR